MAIDVGAGYLKKTWEIDRLTGACQRLRYACRLLSGAARPRGLSRHSTPKQEGSCRPA